MLSLASSHATFAAPKAVAPKAPAGSAVGGTSAEAEFEVVAAGDDLYRLLGVVQRGGLLQSAPKSGATRYEVALETGRATLALSSKRAAQARVGEDAAKALSELLVRLRPELRRLDVDVDAALLLCRAGAGTLGSPALLAPGPRSNGNTRGVASALESSRLRAEPRSLSQRLRDSAYQTLHARDSGDPFGGTVERSRSFFGAGASNRSGAAFFEPVNVGPHRLSSTEGSLSTSLSVIGGLRVRAGLSTSGPSALAGGLGVLGSGSPDALLLSPDGSSRSVGVGADISLPVGVTLSGDVAHLSTGLASGGSSAGGLGASFAGAGGFEGTRIGGQARVSAFNDRLELSANWARLMPEQQANFGAQTSSSAGLGLAVGDQNFKLKLLYQELFGSSSSGQANRVIAGGVNISF